jgi:pimeloyl-ACP methyl ester carboxylesterase
MNNLGIEQVMIVGHALGASVALEYVICYPDRVNKVTLVSLPLTLDSLSRKLIGLAHNSVVAQIIWRRQITHREVHKEAEKTDRAAIRLSLQSLARIDIHSRIQRIGQLQKAMMLVVYGEKDDMVDPAPARGLNGHWPNIRSIGLPASKHFPMLDEPAKFSRLLKDFLEVQKDLSVLELKEEWRRRTR